MSLYRTWRPKTFEDLVGQDAVVRTLTAALETGKLAHAYLFSGPRGSGKTSAAKILARCIDCVLGPTPHPDNTCENCTAIIAGTALDVLEIDAASNRGIDEIRALRDAVKFPPASMRSKVYIIDEAHMLTKEGANAFLKTLEEPPEWAVFILATTAPEALPPTILSRCQRYAFRRIAIPVMIERMREIAGNEAIVIDDGALSAIAYRADGGLRDALTMLEQVAAFAQGPIDVMTVEAAFGVTSREFARNVTDAILAGDAAAALRAIDEASDAGADMVGLIRAVMGEFRHLLVARVNPELLARDLAADDAARARELAARTPQAKLVRALRLLTEALSAARSFGQPRIELEAVALRLVLAAEDPSLDALAMRVTQLESGARPASPLPAAARTAALPPAAVPPAAPSAPPPLQRAAAQAPPERPRAAAPAPVRRSAQAAAAARPAEPPPPRPVASTQPLPDASSATPAAPGDGEPLSLQKVRSTWQSVRTRIEGEKQSLAVPLSRTRVERIDGKVLTLAVPDAIQGEVLRANIPMVRRALADVLGRPLEVAVRVDAGAPPPPDAGDEADDLMNYALRKLS